MKINYSFKIRGAENITISSGLVAFPEAPPFFQSDKS